MGVRDCLISAAEQGALTKAEARDLADRFDELHAQSRLNLGDGAAAQAAKDALERELRFAAGEARRRADLDRAAGQRLKTFLQGYRDEQGRPDIFEAAKGLIEHYGYIGTSSIVGRSKAIIALAHSELVDVMRTFRRSYLGGRLNRVMLPDLVRELRGEPTGKPEVKAMAGAIEGVFEHLRERFNAAGGAIPKLEGWGLPQSHDAAAILRVGRARWKQDLAPRLDMARMRDPLTGDPLTPAGLDRLLDVAYGNIVSDGMSRMEPQTRPLTRGALASQRQEHRVLIFKSTDDWLAYDAQFGRGDPLAAIFEHIVGMARDIAAMEVLGPNPGARMNWLKQVVQREAGRAIEGQPSLYRLSGGVASQLDQPRWIDYRLDALYDAATGQNPVSRRLATVAGDVRNVITSAVLGGASVVAATTDPVLDAAARYLSGLPVVKALKPVVLDLSKMKREDAARAGLVVEEWMHILSDHARYAGLITGSEWSRWLADQTIRKSGLNAMTEARRAVFALDFGATLADEAGTAWDALPVRLRETMQGYGIDRTDWGVIQMTPIAQAAPDVSGHLRPADIARLADGPALAEVQKRLGLTVEDTAEARAAAQAGARRTAEKVLEMIHGQMERAVPSGTRRTRSLVTGAVRPGTAIGEGVQSVLQFKSFVLSFTMLQVEAIMREAARDGLPAGATYAGAIMLGLTLGGGIAMQLKSIAAGKDPEPMDSPDYWIQAAMTGGGFGLMGDFLFADVNRFGHSLGQTLAGPSVQLASDLMGATAGNAQELAKGDATNAGREVIALASKWTPLASSLWYTRAAYRRVLLDQLSHATDPEAHRRFRAQERNLYRERSQEFWWRPGEPLPERAPALWPAR